MKFIHRLGYYFGGFSVGLIFLAFFLNGKRASCDYSPQARVIKNINSKKRVLLIDAQNSLNQLEIDTTDLVNILRTGNVNFSKSNTHRDSCNIYVIESEHKDKPITIEVQNCDKKAIITKVN